MEAATGNNITSHVTKGLILAVILIIYSVVGHLANLLQRDWYFMEGVGIFVAGIVWGVVNYAGQMKGEVDFSKLLVYGLKLAAVVTCLLFIYSLLEVYLFFPGYMQQKVMSYALRASKNGKIDQESYNANKDEAVKVLTTMYFAGTVMGTMIVGLLSTLVGGVLAKKNPVIPIVQ